MCMLSAVLTTYATWKLDTRLHYWNLEYSNDKFSKSTFKLPAAARRSTWVLHASRAATAGTPARAWKWRVVSAEAEVVNFVLLSRLHYIEKVL